MATTINVITPGREVDGSSGAASLASVPAVIPGHAEAGHGEGGVKTPMAYSGTRLLTSASLMISSPTDTMASRMIALENTSRWPRFEQPPGQE